MNESILKKVKELQEKAKKVGKSNIDRPKVLSQLKGNSLNDIIKTKEDADLFMKRMNALHE